MYAVKSGDGYFVRFQENAPEMTTDPTEARLMSKDQAQEVLESLDYLNLAAEMIKEQDLLTEPNG